MIRFGKADGITHVFVTLFFIVFSVLNIFHSFNKWSWENWICTCKSMKVDTLPYRKPIQNRLKTSM